MKTLRTSNQSRLRSLPAVIFLGALTSIAGCTDDSKTKGQIMLAVSTDMAIDSDLDRVDVLVERENGEIFNTPIELYPKEGGLFTPGSYAIVEGNTPGESVRVSLVARKGKTARVVRELSTTLPRERISMINMPIQWLCESEVSDNGKQSACLESAKNEDKTCNLGRCADLAVLLDEQEAYDPDTLYSGYASSLEAARAGACFDVLRCFDGSRRADVDLDTCRVTRPAGMKTPNIALVVENDGHCNPLTGVCYVALDQSKAYGWTETKGTFQLPPAVCDRLKDGRVLSVVTSGSCDTKTIQTPTCGPWLGPLGSNDRDDDGILDDEDNCPNEANKKQQDADGDGIGDVCDFATTLVDKDGDGLADDDDNCPANANAKQEDTDSDEAGDACDDDDDDDGYPDTDDPAPLNPFEPDSDLDGVISTNDNCPSIANKTQADLDQDGRGDACDDDEDGDGVVNKLDNCSKRANTDQTDCDADGEGDACEVCPSTITITNPLNNSVQSSRIFKVTGTVGTLSLSELSIVSQSLENTKSLRQTIAVSGATFQSDNLILNAGRNQITAETCNCQSTPVTLTANVAPADILVTLTWAQNPADVDLYIYEPYDSNNTVCYFDATCAGGRGTTVLGGVLDTDNTKGFGPENYTLSRAEGDNLVAGSYRIRAHYFDGSGPVDYRLRVLLREGQSDEEVVTLSGRIEQSSRTNTDPNLSGTGWVDIATVDCTGAPVRCTVNATTNGGSNNGTGGTGGTTGAGGTSGVGVASSVTSTASGGTLGAGGISGAGGTSQTVLTTVAQLDRDQDGFSDGSDNCIAISNKTQLDTDSDGIGDSCECSQSYFYQFTTGTCIYCEAFSSQTFEPSEFVFGPSSNSSYDPETQTLSLELALASAGLSGGTLDVWTYLTDSSLNGLSMYGSTLVTSLPLSRLFANTMFFDLRSVNPNQNGLSYAIARLGRGCGGGGDIPLALRLLPNPQTTTQALSLYRVGQCVEALAPSITEGTLWTGTTLGAGFDHERVWQSECLATAEDLGLGFTAPQTGTYTFNWVPLDDGAMPGLAVLDGSCSEMFGCARQGVMTIPLTQGDSIVIVIGGATPAATFRGSLEVSFVIGG